ncbi:MAG: methyltransferase [Candidatus Binataceae bacterium]
METQTTPPQPAQPPPQMVLFQMMSGYYISCALYVAAKLCIADHLADGPRNYLDLAKAANAHAPSLNRVMRLLASVGVFREEDAGNFALTPLGELLRSGVPGSARAAALVWGGMTMRAWSDLEYSVQTGKPAFHHMFGMDSFSYLQQHPEESANFDAAMADFTKLVGVAVVAAYDFSEFGSIIDVGGGNGALIAAVLNANPNLRGALFDLPHVALGAKARLDAAGLGRRCEIFGGDFFTDSLPTGRDAYMLKHVIHDWDDDHALKILTTCRRAMGPGAKLLIVEGVYPLRSDHSDASRGAASNDVNMLVCTSGKQRSEAEFRALFAAAGFKLGRIVPTMARVCVIEGVRA